MSDRRNGVPTTVTSIPLVDPHAPKPDPSIGDLVKDATAQVSTLVRGRGGAGQGRDHPRRQEGPHRQRLLHPARWWCCSTPRSFFFFAAELLDTWLWRWAAFLIVFGVMVVVTAIFALLGYLKVRRIRGPQKTIESVKETPRGADARPRQGQAAIEPARRRKAREARLRPRSVGLVMPPDPSVVRIDGPWRHLEVHANGIRFHVVEAESQDSTSIPVTERPLVILLHGFGSFWWSWRHQLRGLTGARVVAVDLRGYGGSDKPPRGYDGWTLAGDTAGLVRALGHKSATLMGHADGGLVCWATSVLHPRSGARRSVGRQLTASCRAARVGADADATRAGRCCGCCADQVPFVARAVADPPRRVPSSSDWSAAGRHEKWIASEDFAETICHMRQGDPDPCPRRTPRWSTSAGPCAASSAVRAGAS